MITIRPTDTVAGLRALLERPMPVRAKRIDTDTFRIGTLATGYKLGAKGDYLASGMNGVLFIVDRATVEDKMRLGGVMGTQSNTMFAHLITASVYSTAVKAAQLLGPSSGDGLSYDAIRLSPSGMNPGTHFLAIGSCRSEWAAASRYLHTRPDVMAAQTGLPLADCQSLCDNSTLYVDTVGDEVLSLEAILAANGLKRI